MDQLITYSLHLADTTLILAQRNAEWCAHGPILEQDIAITNITLDLIGQSRNFYQYAATLINQSAEAVAEPATEDSLAYLRTEREYKNLLITELPNGDWANTILRQFFFSVFQFGLLEQLQKGSDAQLAAIAEKSIKETTYHVKWSSEWVIRLGDGTEESHQRMINAIHNLWTYTGEFFIPAVYEKDVLPHVDFDALKSAWLEKITEIFTEATLSVPPASFMQTGGKTGHHTEHLGFILTDLQHLQKTYPGAEW
ncbi:MAG: phenylacetate-CoA oxygenase, PaaI subunit [Ferruginibacter sp.]|nr:phenylacetate-CoA oxygenase, PaaI subunit [Ferruginibacter sp.]